MPLISASFDRRSSADKAQALVRAATELFGRRRYGAVGVVDIAHEAGMSKANFYNYFDGKDQLFLVCHAQAMHQRIDRLHAAMRAGADEAPARQRMLAQAVRDSGMDLLCRVPPEMSAAASRDDGLNQALVAVRAGLQRRLRGLVEQACAGDAADAASLDVAATMLLCLMSSYLPLLELAPALAGTDALHDLLLRLSAVSG